MLQVKKHAVSLIPIDWDEAIQAGGVRFVDQVELIENILCSECFVIRESFGEVDIKSIKLSYPDKKFPSRGVALFLYSYEGDDD